MTGSGLVGDWENDHEAMRIEWFLQPIDGMRPEALQAIEELKGKGIYW